ncbi:MAG: NlpC/P60 family protein [Clostridium perfringens]
MKQKEKIYQIFIANNGKIYQPVIKGKVTIKWERGFKAGILEFDVVKDEIIDYQEGNPVSFSIDGKTVFKGYVFKKTRDKRQVISTVCYDQIRYLKSRDTYQYSSKSMSDLLKQICSDRNLQVGDIEDTSYKIPKRLEKNQEYLNMVKVANDITLSQTGKIYTLFDDCGKISLKSADKMIVNCPISYDNIVDFSYETSIDDGTYNRVVVYLTDDDGRLIKKVVKQDEKNIAKWGVLEYTLTTNNAEDIENKASQILEVLNRKYRSLTIKEAIGDIRVRAGSVIPVEMMAIGDININSYMLVEKVTHTFFDDAHFMDLEVMNKDIQKIGDVDGIIKDKEKQNKNSNVSDFYDAGKAVRKSNKLYGSIELQTKDLPKASTRKMQTIVNKAESMIGTRAYKGRCQGFVRVCYESAGIHGSAGSAKTAGNKWIVSSSRDNIPVGATVYFNSPYSPQFGHVGIYVGNGMMIDATDTTVKKHKIGGWWKHYRGWGYQGGVVPK